MREIGGQGFWSFGTFWIVINTIGWGLLTLLSTAAGWIVWELYNSFGFELMVRFRALNLLESGSVELIRTLIAGTIAFLCWGATLGVIQQYALGRRFELETRGWIWATIIGIVVYMTTRSSILYFVAIIGFSYSQILNTIFSFLSPLALGIAQWIFLRQYFKRAELWIAATTIALWISYFLNSTFLTGQFNTSFYVAFTLIEGFLYGIATLIAISIISRQPTVVVNEE